MLPSDVLRCDQKSGRAATLDPRVSQDHLGGQTFSRVLDQEPGDHVLRLGRNLAPLAVRELVATVLGSTL